MALQIPLPLIYSSDYKREHFHVFQGNQLALNWIDWWPDWPQPRLVIFGDEGCGKTHLAHLWSEKSKAIWLDASIMEAQSPDTVASAAPAFILDTPVFDEVWLFHFYNICHDKPWLICNRLPPSQWTFHLKDLESRLLTIPAIALKSPDDTALKELLRKLFRDRGILIPDTIVAYLLNRIDRSFVQLKALVRDVDLFALTHKRRITLSLIRDYLSSEHTEEG